MTHREKLPSGRATVADGPLSKAAVQAFHDRLLALLPASADLPAAAWDFSCDYTASSLGVRASSDEEAQRGRARVAAVRSGLSFGPGWVEFRRSGLKVARQNYGTGPHSAELFGFDQVRTLMESRLDVPSVEDWKDMLGAMPSRLLNPDVLPVFDEEANAQLCAVLGLGPSVADGPHAASVPPAAVPNAFWTRDAYFPGAGQSHHTASAYAFVAYGAVTESRRPAILHFQEARKLPIRPVLKRPASN